MEFKVLGPLEVVDEGAVSTVEAAGQRRLLALLVRHAGEVVSVGALTDALWEMDPPRTARHAVHTQISRLRARLGLDPILRTRAPGYVLAVDRGQVDSREFERLLGEARHESDPARAEAVLSRALSLWRGPAYGELADHPVLRGEAIRLEHLRVAAVEMRARALLDTGRAVLAIGDLEALVAEQPLREESWTALMRALAVDGRQAEALQTFGRLRAHLRAEGLDPSPAAHALQMDVLRGHVGPPAHRSGGPPAPLRMPVHQAGASSRPVDLVEREEPLRALVAAREAARRGEGQVVLVRGEPGIGKTALVRAFTHGPAAGDRILWGGCDDLITPRPLAPFADMSALHPELARELLSPSRAVHAHRLLLDDLDQSPWPTVLVIEDMHWADEATLDLAMRVVRRIAGVHALVVLTYRDTELTDSHPLLPVLAAVPPIALREVRLEPLSRDAVVRLVGAGRAAHIMELSGGNPFFVTELAEAPADEVPASVRSAVLARIARLPAMTRELLALLAVEPIRLEVDVLDSVRPDWNTVVIPAERGGIVDVEGRAVRFRHELTRQTVLDSVPAAQRRRLHLDLLPVLVDRAMDAARIVHHAEAGGDRRALAEFSLRAARQAAGLSAHREAHSHFCRVLRLLDEITPGDRPLVHEEASREAYLSDHEPEALEYARVALAGYEARGDTVSIGRMHRWVSRLHWFGGRGADADRAARRAVDVLKPLGPSAELAWAYSTLSQLAMLDSREADAQRWGERALDLAERVGAPAVRAHALVNIGSARRAVDPDDETPLLDAFAAADAVGEHHEAARALLNLAGGLMEANRIGQARDVAARALSYAEEHEVEALAHYVAVTLARVDVLAGRWSDAEPRLRDALRAGGFVVSAFALGTLALLQVRRGDDDAATTLGAAWELARPTEELQRLGPLAALTAERAWLCDELSPDSPDLRSCFENALSEDPVLAGELARWLHEAGGLAHVPGAIDRPYRLELAGQLEAAAQVWAERGMPYDRALCLARSTDHAAEALAIAEGLGAAPLAMWIRRRACERHAPGRC